ncbi:MULTISPECIES: shikimate kinase [unclassified Lentimonas]|uniref:shikimate kinase n=1 Tax=unclassified Lentimonas TaxID=2630993 RepID=UPI00132CA5EF|nr:MULTISPECIES: shikimate kinase [unclassified Lentimonas]CAA6677929.1 Shikimate kinase I (EC [Lentimonas sp. CC4]CAA6684033.1 Shikimate kinase I (EC [Lentimonas sp. CC6]CAA7076591.1 Shikimate kinase I (EC [Lentimonas sp. CC4]CAA7170080.1 Shikimate kinase I (EC [Lentimonas sp. CC21]CAA7181365.1 Shikimate kinase I (EC [Lentimonas sp. CC8]
MTTPSNLVLIGMPSCGKSTLGVLLAKHLTMSFMDTDLVIQAEVDMRLQEYQQSQGMAGFRALEERVLCSVECERTVIATGGSAVYYPAAMAHLKALGRVVFLDVSFEVVRARIGDLAERGVVFEPGMTFEELLSTRQSLYHQYADCVVDCGCKPLHELVHEVAGLMTSF